MLPVINTISNDNWKDEGRTMKRFVIAMCVDGIDRSELLRSKFGE